RRPGARLRARRDPLGPRATPARFGGGARRPRWRRTGGGGAPGARTALAQQVIHGGTELGGRFHRANARRLEGRVLVGRGALAARDDGPGVPHALASRMGYAGDMGDPWLADHIAYVSYGRLHNNQLEPTLGLVN